MTCLGIRLRACVVSSPSVSARWGSLYSSPHHGQIVKVLGFSGFHNSIDVKRTFFPELDHRYDRIAQGFDSAAALICDGKVIAAAEEERFNLDKSTNAFPINAINYCLRTGGIDVDDLDYIAHGFAYEPFRDYFEHSDYSRTQFSAVYSREAVLNCLQTQLGNLNDTHRFVQINHHLAHAASTYYLSGFQDALVLVVDGMGEIHSASVYAGRSGHLQVLRQIPALHSLGILYSVFTMYLGFMTGFDEYKVMGLAPYGNRRTYFTRMMSLIKLGDNGSFTIPVLVNNPTPLEKETYSGSMEYLVMEFGPARHPGDKITQRHKDIAAALQACLEATLMHILGYFRKETQLDHLCMAGGVALNCSANGVIFRSRLFKDMFVQPAAGDNGTALGAALQVSLRKQDVPVSDELQFWGPNYSNKAVEAILLKRPDCKFHQYDSQATLIEEVAHRLARGEIIAWFQGRMEFGPRALGKRSILADPREASMRDRINRIVKKREDFRPFAPAVVSEEATRYFEIREGTEHAFRSMLIVAHVREEHASNLAAVTHVDGSARIQTVNQSNHPKFWQLLKAFETQTGIPVLLNTSFNVRGQPIVCSPIDAIDTFLQCEVDALVIEDFIVLKNHIG